MKKLFLLLPILALTTIGATGCKSNKKSSLPVLTYGSYVDNEATALTYKGLQQKVTDKEVMLISVYSDTLPCGCWTTFKQVMDEYVNKYHTKIYYIARSQFSKDDDTFGLTILEQGTNPTFALMQNGKKSTEYIYSSDNKPMFETLDGLRSAITRLAQDPVYMYVNEEYLDESIFTHKKDKVAIYYLWSFCPDCNDCFPKVLLPYAEKNELKTEIWMIDLGIPGILLTKDGEWPEEGTSIQTYVDFLEEHHMSAKGDDIFGYDRGFVPTFQIWEKGELKDMCIYFNDVIEKIDDEYIITRSYYTDERVKHLSYTNTTLKGIGVLEDEVTANSDGTYSWNQEAARKYHQPILESFLDTYVKK